MSFRIMQIVFAVMATGALHAGVIGLEIVRPSGTVYDLTSEPGDTLPAVRQIEVEKVKREVDAIMGFFSRAPQIESCVDYGNGEMGCPIESVACSLEFEPVICPEGGRLNGERDMCQVDPDVDCPEGYEWDKDLDRCVNKDVCPAGSVLNSALDRCEKIVRNECPSGYTYDSARDVCWKGVDCGIGSFNAAADRCEIAVTHECPAGYTYVGATKRCEKPPVCPSGTTYRYEYNKCLVAFTKGCPSGYRYVSSRDRCEKYPLCPAGTTYSTATNRCEGSASCSTGTYDPATGKCKTVKEGEGDLSLEWKGVFDEGAVKKWINTKNARFYVQGGSDIFGYDYVKLEISSLSAKNGKRVAATVRRGDNWWEGYIAVVSSDSTIGRSSVSYDCGRLWCTDVKASFEWGNVYIDNTDSYYGTYAWRSNINGILGPGKHVFYRTSYIDVKPGYKVGYFTDKKGNVEFLWTKGDNIVTYTSPICPTGQYNLNGTCVANPVCSGGQLDASLDRCYTAYMKNCPTGTVYSSNIGACITDPICTGGLLDGPRDVCYVVPTDSCPSGYRMGSGVCYTPPVCLDGAYDADANRCQAKVVRECGSGFLWDEAARKCVSAPVCPDDSAYSLRSTITYDKGLDRCLSEAVHECAGDYSYNVGQRMCELVPICANSVYDPEADRCYRGDRCPIDPSLRCVGPAKNSWCSPHPCNAQGLCGVARCLQGTATSSSPVMDRSKYFSIEPGAGASGICRDQVCDLVIWKEVSYCGQASCPKGFGIYEEGGRCYKDVCPEESYEFDGKCYKDGCPDGYILSEEGRCLPE